MLHKSEKGFSQEGWWTATLLMEAMPGCWLNPPPEGWRATGVSIFAPAMRPGNMVCIWAEKEKGGVAAENISRLPYPPAALIVSEPDFEIESDVPVYLVDNWSAALLIMGRYVREQMHGNIIGITGSAGKTTCVAMLATALEEWGPVRSSQENANLPRGVAWNIASMPWDTPQVILELAIGRMEISSRMVSPTVAMVTNIQAAHLKYHKSVQNIARAKAKIFLGMAPGGIAVLNRDMAEWQCVYDAAVEQGLRVVTYGLREGCDCRLLDYDAATGRVTADISGHPLRYVLEVDGQHMALNSVATLAVIAALGYSPEEALPNLARFRALPGRGEVNYLTVAAHPVTVIDDAYNANPGSMMAAITQLNELMQPGRKVIVMGEMAELGESDEQYYLSLIEAINRSQITCVYLLGHVYEKFSEVMSADKQYILLPEIESFRRVYLNHLQDNDIVLFKGSNATQVWKLVKWLKALASR